MRYSTTINNKFALDHELDIKLAYLFAWFYELPSWANHIVFNNQTYYFASKTKAVQELPLLTDKTDTMYRYYKQLQKKGLIDCIKVDGKDYVKLLDAGKQWNEWKSEYSEINPNKLGNKSESNSEINPTYNNISYNNTINNISSEILDCYNNCLKFFPKDLHPKNKKNWIDTIEKLNRIDKVSLSEIEFLVMSARNDSFWCNNFLSLVKLRKKQHSTDLPYYKVFREKFKKSTQLNPTGDTSVLDKIKQKYG